MYLCINMASWPDEGGVVMRNLLNYFGYRYNLSCYRYNIYQFVFISL